MGDSPKCHLSSQGFRSMAASRLSGPRAVLSEPVFGRFMLREDPLPALPRTVPSLWPKGRLSLKSSSCPHGPSESKTKRRKKRKWTFSHAFWTAGTQFPGSSGQKNRLLFQLPAPPASLALQRACYPVPFTHDSEGGGDLPPYSPACVFLVFWLKRWNFPWFSATVAQLS